MNNSQDSSNIFFSALLNLRLVVSRFPVKSATKASKRFQRCTSLFRRCKEFSPDARRFEFATRVAQSRLGVSGQGGHMLLFWRSYFGRTESCHPFSVHNRFPNATASRLFSRISPSRFLE